MGVGGGRSAFGATGTSAPPSRMPPVAVEVQVKAKLEGLDLAGTDLMAQRSWLTESSRAYERAPVGSTEVTPGDRGGHEGATLFGMGVRLAIRNLATHCAHEPVEQALEQLAALSVIARWVDAAEKMT
jgi:Protein of unknown function (Hypoth_ymh)